MRKIEKTQFHGTSKIQKLANDSRRIILGRKKRKQPPLSKISTAKQVPVFFESNLETCLESMKLNTNRTCIINQFAGLGDILFCEPIAAMLSEWGYKILWPVLPHYCSLNKHFPNITFINKNLLDINYEDRNFVNPDGCLIIPLRFSLEISSGSLQDTMPSKYSMFKLDWKDYWSKSKWNRDSKSENELFYDILNLRDGEKYNLISDHFLSDFSQKIIIQTGNLKNINVERISDYTLIDWSKVIENATTIHAVGSSINYIIDKLNCKAEEYHLYARKPLERDCSMYDFIFTTKYRIHL